VTYNQIKTFMLDPGETALLEAYGDSGDRANIFGCFQEPISYDAKYLIITIDEIAGMSNLNWRYDLQ
jgi:hypothetical protein